MNLIIKNQNYKIIDSLTIDVIKTLNGEFDRQDLDRELVNFVYNKAIIDITAIKNFYDISSVLDFLSFFKDGSVILLLNNSELVNSNSYLKFLVQKGYYNFTRNAAGINYLLNKPNTLDDVRKFMIDESVITNNINNTSVSNYNGPNNYGTINNNSNQVQVSSENFKNSNQMVIGIQNISDHAGATTLMYMMVKQLKFNYKVKGIEMFKQDSIYFHNEDISMCTSIDDLKIKIKSFNNMEVIVVDLNGLDANDICDEILYVLEPGIIRLNKAIKRDHNLLTKVSNGKLIINRSNIRDEEINNFEYETKFKVFMNIPNINERTERIQIIDKLLIKLGFKKQNMGSGGLFGIF